jgi:presqualene diphosphate synthase
MMSEAILDPQSAKARASGSSFYAGMRVLPRPRREAMFAIYAFSRAVDDIADEGDVSRAARRAELSRWRRDIEALYAGSTSPRAGFLSTAVERYALRKEDFLTIIDGMEMDVLEDIRAPDLAKLDLYCERVASAVGRLSVKIFGMEEGPGFELACYLGRALQLTNILRDLDQDAAIGRLYLPREYLDDAGIDTSDPAAVILDTAVDESCRAVARLAHRHYRSTDMLLLGRPRGLLHAPRLMAAVYERLLAKMEAKGWAPPRQRARIGSGEFLLTALRCGLVG